VNMIGNYIKWIITKPRSVIDATTYFRRDLCILHFWDEI